MFYGDYRSHIQRSKVTCLVLNLLTLSIEDSENVSKYLDGLEFRNNELESASSWAMLRNYELSDN